MGLHGVTIRKITVQILFDHEYVKSDFSENAGTQNECSLD
jgi:hypothetical protein